MSWSFIASLGQLWGAGGVPINSAELAFTVSLALFGFLAIIGGGWFTYETHFQHPQLSYLPTDEAWREHLGSLVHHAQLATQALSSEASSVVEPSPTSRQTLWVDISGAVSQPGVYEVQPGSRWQDVVLMAGGFLPEANQQFVHQSLNLAVQVVDQSKLYVPLAGEVDVATPIQEQGSTRPSSTTPAESSSNSQPLNVNTATASQLEELPNIGAKRAADIIANRPYTTGQDFLERSGLSTNLAQELMQELIVIE